VLLAGCEARPIFTFVVEDTTCEPPCWANIHPGETTAVEVGNILSTSPWVEKDSIFSTQYLALDAIFWEFVDGSQGYVLLKNSTVWMLCFASNDSGSLNIKLAQAIDDKYGEPEKVFSAFNPNIPDWGGVTFFHPEKGVDYSYSSHIDTKKYQGILRPESPISDLTYYSPEDHLDVFQKFFVERE